MQKISIFVDVQNIYYTCRQAFSSNFDYNAFWTRVTEGREVVKAFAYAIDRGDDKQKQFQNILRAIGFEVKLKPFIERKDGSAKGDWDVGIAIDIMESAKDSDIIVLASGDGDFSILLDKVKTDYGIQAEVYGAQELTARALIKSASKFIPIQHSLLL